MREKISEINGKPFQELRRENGYWNDPENVLNEALKFLEEHPEYEQLPSQKILRELGYNHLNFGSRKTFGGLTGLRECLSKKLGQSTEVQKLEATLTGYIGGGRE